MTDEPAFTRLIWGLLGSVAGAITALSFQSWKDMTRGQILMSLFVAASFSFFVAPLFFSSVRDTRAAGGIFYLMATGSNVLIPRAVKWLSSAFNGGSEPQGPEAKP